MPEQTPAPTTVPPATPATPADPPPWTPPASQADLDRIIQDRLRRHKPDGYDDLLAKATRLDALELELGTTADKAAATAKAEALKEMTPRVVRAEFRAAAKGVLTGEQLDALLEDVDLSRYLDAKGNVDEAKVERKVNAFAPSKQQPTSRTGVGFGQGTQPPARVSAKELGAAEAAKRFGKKTA